MLAYDFLRRNRQSEDSNPSVQVTKPGGRLTYGVVHSPCHYPIFVAVTIDEDDSHVYRLINRKKRMAIYGMDDQLAWRLQCRDCNQTSSEVNGTVKHSMRQNGKRCVGSGDKQKRAASWAIRQWAAVRPNEEAKEAGRDYFTQEDLHKWMEVAGYIPKIPNKEKYEALRSFVRYLESQPDRLCKLLKRTKQGEDVVRRTNELKAWRTVVDQRLQTSQMITEMIPEQRIPEKMIPETPPLTPEPPTTTLQGHMSLTDNSIPPQEMATQECPLFISVAIDSDPVAEV